MPDSSITLYGMNLSGHCHRVELLLRMLNLPFRYETVSPEDRHSPRFLALNPLAQIPVLTDGDLTLPDFNAILVYLAFRYDGARIWHPEDPVIAARIQRWLSVAAGEVRFGPAMARVIRISGYPLHSRSPQCWGWVAGGNDLMVGCRSYGNGPAGRGDGRAARGPGNAGD